MYVIAGPYVPMTVFSIAILAFEEQARSFSPFCPLTKETVEISNYSAVESNGVLVKFSSLLS